MTDDTAKDPERVRRIVSDTLVDRLGPLPSLQVFVRPDIGLYDNPIWLIDVVLDGKDWKKLDPDETVGMIGRVWDRLSASGDGSFPVISYVLKSEYRGRRAAAA